MFEMGSNVLAVEFDKMGLSCQILHDVYSNVLDNS